MVEGLISFVFGAIKKRRATRRTTHYEHFSSPSGSPPPPPPTRGLPADRFIVTAAGGGGGTYYSSHNAHQQQSNAAATQSCRFVVAPSLAQELGLWRGDDDGRTLLHAPPSSAATGDERGVSRSRRFGSTRM